MGIGVLKKDGKKKTAKEQFWVDLLWWLILGVSLSRANYLEICHMVFFYYCEGIL